MIEPGVIEFLALTLLFAPLVLVGLLLVLGLLSGKISAAGLWNDSFSPDDGSPARIYQFIATIVAAAVILLPLFKGTATSFGPVPDWLVVAAGGGNMTYLIAKFTAARRATAAAKS